MAKRLVVQSETRIFGIPIIRRFGAKPQTPAKEPKIPAELAITSDRSHQQPFADTKLTYSKVREILKDPVVKFCNLVMSAPVSRVQLNVLGQDNEQVEFIKQVLIDSGIATDYLMKATTARYYGFYIAEVRYTVLPDGRIGLRTFKGLPPERCELKEENGSLVGVQYTQPTVPFQKVLLPSQDGKFILVTNRWQESEFNRYGISELEEAREWVFAKRLIKDLMLRWIETKADPATINYFSPSVIGTQTSEGEITAANIGERALRIAQRLRQGGNAALPKDSEGKKLFEIEYLTGADRMPLFGQAIQVCNTEIARALLIPDKAVTEGSGTGTYAQAQVHAQFLYQLQEDLATTLLAPLNRYVLPKLLAWNFATPDPTLRIYHAGLRDIDRALVELVLREILEIVKSGTPLPGELVDYIRKQTGIPISADFVGRPSVTGFSRQSQGGEAVLATRQKSKLNRKLTPREELYGEKYFLAFLARWEDLEDGMQRELVSLIKQQREKFMADLKAALAKESKSERLEAVRTFGLRLTGQITAVVQKWLRKAAEFGMDRVAKELKLPKALEFSAGLATFIETQAKIATEGALSRLLTSLRSSVMRAINQKLPEKQIADRVADIFEDFIEKRIEQEFITQIGVAVNQGRNEVLEAPLDDPIVSVTRVAVMDERTCEVCEYLDMKTISIDDPDLALFLPPSQCLGGGRCRCIDVYNQESMRPEFREVNYKPPPARLQEKIWY